MLILAVDPVFLASAVEGDAEAAHVGLDVVHARPVVLVEDQADVLKIAGSLCRERPGVVIGVAGVRVVREEVSLDDGEDFELQEIEVSAVTLVILEPRREPTHLPTNRR